MKNGKKTKKQLIDELVELRQRVAELEKLEVKQKRAEKKLKAASNEWRTTFDSASELIMLLDSKMEIIKANLATVKFLNMPFNEIIGKTCFKLFHGTDKPPDICPLVKSQKTKQHEEAELYLSEKDIWIFVSTDPIFDDKGNLTKTVHIMKDITKRKRVEMLLQESQAKYKAIFEATGTATLIVEEDTTIIMANRECFLVSGYSPEELIGTKWTNYVAPESSEIMLKYHKLRREEPGKAPRKYEVKLVNKNGKIRNAILDIGMIPGNKQSVVSMLDITERKQVEEELIQAHRDWEEIFQAIGHPTFMLDPEHNILLANRAAVKASERTEEELKGKKCYEVFHGTDQPPENCPLEKMLRSGRLEVVEMEMEALGGVFLVSCTPVLDDRGNVQRVIHIATDITERKKAEESLKKSEQKLQSIIEHSNEIFYIHDTHHKFTYVSLQSLPILGYTPDEMMIEWIKLVSENPINIKGIEITEKALNTGERQKPYLLEVYKKDGRKVWLEIDESPLKDDKGNVIGIVGAARDITDRKRVEEELRSSYEQLHRLAAHLQSIREEERTEIARDIHDELSQTLTGLKFDLLWLQNKMLRAEDGASLIEKINSMSHILDNTIHWARRISMSLRPSVLDDLGLVAALEWQANEFQTRTGIACIFTSFSESVFLDREESTSLFRICQESLTNVARHSDATAVTINLKEAGVNLILEVSDNGKGITETQITDTKSLGLLGMKERALILNGEFTVSGIPGKGTTVIVKIPRRE